MRRRWLLAVALMVPLVASLGATRVDASPPSGADGKHIYEQRCLTCHGAKGDGAGPTAMFLTGPRPRDFTRGLFEFRTTEGGKPPRRSDIVRTARVGIPLTQMPAFGAILPPGDLEAVAQYIEGFSPKFAQMPESDRTTIEIPPEPAAATAAELQQGKMFYIAFKCWECHGLTGDSDGPANPLFDDWKKPIKPANFSFGKYKSGKKATDLYRSIATGLDGTPMPTFKLAVVIGREGMSDLGKYADKLDPALRKQVTEFIATRLPDEKVFALSDADREKFAQRRIWLLVRYVQSLSNRGVVDWVTDDPWEL